MPLEFLVAACLGSALLLIALSILWGTLRTGISPMPSSLRARAQIIELARRRSPSVLYELGGGFGSLAIPLAKQFPNAQVVAYELSWFPFSIAFLRATFSGLDNLSVQRADFLHQDLSDADLLVCYLFPGGMHALASKLERKPCRTYVISNTFALPGHRPVETHRLNDLYKSPIYLYALTSKTRES